MTLRQQCGSIMASRRAKLPVKVPSRSDRRTKGQKEVDITKPIMAVWKYKVEDSSGKTKERGSVSGRRQEA